MMIVYHMDCGTSLVEMYQYFKGTFHLRLKCRRITFCTLYYIFQDSGVLFFLYVIIGFSLIQGLNADHLWSPGWTQICETFWRTSSALSAESI